MLRDKPNLVEADLDRFFHRDLRDLWRFDEQGRRKLTLRQIYARITHGLPHNSALAIDANGGRMPWTLSDHLLADIWGLEAKQLAGKKAPKDHPGRPRTKKAVSSDPRRAEKMRAARRRRAAIRARRQQQEGGSS
ncbi:hypothetical protein [Nocardia sp. CA-290969]|uniref:hypothetical protein n=1 Tax=Nocardia sp. CA-290969 TaxID=3239986 RepID=UPI003D9432F3